MIGTSPHGIRNRADGMDTFLSTAEESIEPALQGRERSAGPAVRSYYELTRQIERLHRRFLDVLRAGLVQMGNSDVTAVQALLLVNIGTEECSMRELMERGYYLGSNAAYNIKKLVEGGYLEQQRSEHDRRAVCIRLTGKGLALYEQVCDLQQNLAARLADAAGGTSREMNEACSSLRRLERVWTDFIDYRRP